MVRRDVVAEPPLALGIVVRRAVTAFISGGLGQGIAEDLVNCISGPLVGLRHIGLFSVIKITLEQR